MAVPEDIQAEVRTFCDFHDLARALGGHLLDGQGKPFVRDIILIDGRAQGNWLTRALLKEGGMQVHMNADMMTTRRFSAWLVSQARELAKGDPMPFDAAPSLIYNLVGPGGPCASDWSQFNGSEELARLKRRTVAEDEAQAAQIKAELVRWRLSHRLAGHFRELLRNDPEWIRRAESKSGGDQATRWTRLWRDLVEQVRGQTGTGPIHEVDVLDDLRGDRGKGALRARLAARLPGRITLVSFGDIPLTVLHVLAELSRAGSAHPLEVVLFHYQPTPGFHLDLGQPRRKGKSQGEPRLLWLGEQGGQPSAALKSPGVPLLAYAGGFFRLQQRKLCDVFDGYGGDPGSAEPPAARSLLQRVQASIHDFESAPAQAPADDGTIAIHRCHGARREVEILRDELLRLFAADPTLQQGDVLMLSPNPELYAPLLEAVLGGREPRISVRTAAMYGTRNSAFAAATKALLDLPEGRVTATELLSLLSMRAIQAKHGWSVEQLEALGKWFKSAPMFWGVDFQHRKDRAGEAAQDADISRVGTLDDFIRRVAVGTATGSREFIHDKGSPAEILPLTSIEGREHLRLASQALEALGIVREWTRLARSPATLADWITRFQSAIRMLPQDDDYLAEYRELCQALDNMRRDVGRFSGPITHGLFREIFVSQCEFSAGAGQFLRGSATLAPLRASSVHPARILVLLGMNDGAFPSQARNIGPEVARPSDGEIQAGMAETFSLQALRAIEDTSAHAFLLLLAAARERLIITFDGYIGDSGKPAAPATPVEMLERLCSQLVVKDAAARFAIRSHGLMEYQRPLGENAANRTTFDRVAADVGAAIVTRGELPVLQPRTTHDLEALKDEAWLALWSQPADLALTELNVAAPQPYYPLPDTEPLEYGTRLVTSIVSYARERSIGSAGLDACRDELRLRGLLPVAPDEASEVLAQATASLMAYEELTGTVPPKPARKFRPAFWIGRGPWVRKARAKLEVKSVVEPTEDSPGSVEFITDNPIKSDNSAELELVALAHILRLSKPGAGKAGLYASATITGMPALRRGADPTKMAAVTVHIAFTDKALEDNGHRIGKMRADFMDLAAHILSAERPLYVKLLAEVLKDSYAKAQKEGDASKSPGPAEDPAAGEPPRFEQKDLTGERGAAEKGANRFILPENVDLVAFANHAEAIFEPGLISRSK